MANSVPGSSRSLDSRLRPSSLLPAMALGSRGPGPPTGLSGTWGDSLLRLRGIDPISPTRRIPPVWQQVQGDEAGDRRCPQPEASVPRFAPSRPQRTCGIAEEHRQHDRRENNSAGLGTSPYASPSGSDGPLIAPSAAGPACRAPRGGPEGCAPGAGPWAGRHDRAAPPQGWLPPGAVRRERRAPHTCRRQWTFAGFRSSGEHRTGADEADGDHKTESSRKRCWPGGEERSECWRERLKQPQARSSS